MDVTKMSRHIWLEYFNRVLLERKAISEEDYRKMKLKIKEKKH